MKIALLSFAFVITALSVVHAAPPPLAIDQALKLAQDHLASRGLAGQHYISSLTLEDSALFGGRTYWFARWVPAIPHDKKSESGLRINMDGSLVRLTSGGPAGTPGRARVGARSIR